jgi:phenylacetate-CoA ligase
MSASSLMELFRLNRNQWANDRDLDAIVLSKLKRQVARAWAHSSFYREKFYKAGFKPEDLRSLSDLYKVPIVKRPELIEAGSSAYCSDINLSNVVWIQTSGSSGTPLRIPFTRQDRFHRVLKELRSLFANGYKPTDRMAIMRMPGISIIKNPLQKTGFFRRYHLSAADHESDQIARLIQIKPHVIYSYASNLRFLAEELEAGNYNHKKPKPKILLSGADRLDLDTIQLLKKEFGVEPIDFYGSMECGWIGWQCPERNGYHINSDCIIVECLRDGKPVPPGEEGELVVTNLHSDAAPMLRYVTGDLGILNPEKCSCGRSFPLISQLVGRVEDCIMVPGGQRLSSHIITSIIEEIPGVRQLQIVQEAPETLRVRLLTKQNRPSEEFVRKEVQKALGNKVNVFVEYPKALEREPNGKFKAVKSFLGTVKPA